MADSFAFLEDFSKIQPGDYLEHRCPRFGIVTQWRVAGIYLGGLNQESVLAVESVTRTPPTGHAAMMVPEQMVRNLSIIRPNAPTPADAIRDLREQEDDDAT